MKKLDFTKIGNHLFEGKVYSFNYFASPEKDVEPSIELTLFDENEVRTFRCVKPNQIEIDSRYSTHNDLGLEFVNVSDGQLEYVNWLVKGILEDVGDFRFWAKDIIEITEKQE